MKPRFAAVVLATFGLEQREALVAFDDTKVGVRELARATTEADCPSTAKEGSP